MKNLLLSSALLLTTTLAFAQLYVAPNTTTSTDSYIYVNDQVVFVEQGIDLNENAFDPDTEASIYLRNESQLVQGTSSTPNSGDGYISVYQDSHSDSYDYNYWSSPIGNPTLGASGNQNFGIKRVFDSITNTRSVVTNTNPYVNSYGSGSGSAIPLEISRRWLFMLPSGSSWTRINGFDVVPAGLGFTMKGTNVTTHTNMYVDPNNQRYDFRGRPNNGNIDVSVVAGASVLSGNPYPSALDLNRVFYDTGANDPDGTINTTNQEITEIRYWDEDRSINSHLYIDNQGGYGTWVPLGSNPNSTNPGAYTQATFFSYYGDGSQGSSSGNMGESVERRYAPIGQGFVIKTNATGTITFKNKHRVYVKEGVANNSQFRSASNTTNPSSGAVIVDADPNPDPNPNEGILPQIRIYSSIGESHVRDMLLVFSDQATDYFDWGYDAYHPMGVALGDAYWPIPVEDEYKAFVIQSLPYAFEKQIPYGLKVNSTQKIRVEAVEEINMPTEDAYLFDSEMNTYTKITGGEAAEFVLSPGDYDDRFYIVFRAPLDRTPELLGEETVEETKASLDFFQNNRVGQLEVGNPEGYELSSANVFDMSGKLVISENNLGNSTRFTFPTATLSDGVYLVRVITSENKEIDYKITVSNRR